MRRLPSFFPKHNPPADTADTADTAGAPSDRGALHRLREHLVDPRQELVFGERLTQKSLAGGELTPSDQLGLRPRADDDHLRFRVRGAERLRELTARRGGERLLNER